MSILTLCRLRATIRAQATVQRLIAKRFGNDQSGATAVEFALVAMPFFVLLFAIIEIAMVFFASQILDTATTEASRLIMTGQTQTQTFNREAFQREVCNRVTLLIPCSGITVDVQTPANFGAANVGRPVGPGGFNQGAGGSVVVVRVTHEWAPTVPTFGLLVGDLPGGRRLLMSAAAFRNEPF